MNITKERSQTLATSRSNRLEQPAYTPAVQVVIVDADSKFKQQLNHALSSIPYLDVVGMADDGYRGVETVARLMPDLVIMDVGMPFLDGITATQKIKSTFPDMRSIILSSRTSETEIIAALSSGADAYCIKGDNIDNLLTAIAAVQDGATYLDAQIAQQVLEHLKPAKPVQSNSSFGQLSQRELEVLRLIVEGYSNPQIGATLYLSTNTVKTYVRGIMNKLVVNDRVQAAVVALRNGII